MATNAPSESKNKKKKKSKKKAPAATTTAGDTSVDAPEPEPAPLDTTAADNSDDSEPEDSDVRPVPTSTDTSVDEDSITKLANGIATADLSSHPSSAENDATARFDALVKDRDALRALVTQLRESLEGLQAKHHSELEAVQTELEETQNERQAVEEQKDAAEEQYQNLLGKVNTIRSQLAERMKSDAEDLAAARTQIDELEEQRAQLQEEYTARSSEVEELQSTVQEQARELERLRSRSNLSQQNWTQEKEELLESEAYLREEFDNAKQAMHDWEVLAMEERTIRKDLADRVADLEEQLAGVRESYERAKEERDTQSSTVEGLQKALQEIQTLRKTELKEVVENSQAELATLREQLEQVQSADAKSRSELDETKRELERALPFEKEVKEKNLLIGKLRHEGVILNDHLTKALRFLKKGKPEDNVDRQIVTNHFLQFLALDRSDPKKFQVLQLIAALLGWSDDQKEQAGLSRPGSNFGSMRGLTVSSPIHRTPSTPALSQEYFTDPGSAISPGSKETLGELWQNFLEQEASLAAKGGKSRTASQSTPAQPPPPS